MSEGEAGFVPQEVVTPKTELKDYAFKTIEEVRSRYPDYSELLDQFSKTGKLGLFQEAPNAEGKHPGITILATPSKLRYTLGYVEIEEKKINWKYKNLPRIYQAISYSPVSQRGAGIQLDHPPTDWNFDPNDVQAKERAYDEFYKVLALLRLHEEF